MLVLAGSGSAVCLMLVLFLVQRYRHDAGIVDAGWAGGLAGLESILGERVADAQLKRWRRNPANKGSTCRPALWRYSRHPNYFFEWLHWWGYVLLTAGSLHMIAALLGPVVMLIFLFRITGTPYTEKQALRSRGDDYRDYQRTTSACFPWFPGKIL